MEMTLQKETAYNYTLKGSFQHKGEDVVVTVSKPGALWHAKVFGNNGRLIASDMRVTRGLLLEELPSMLRRWHVEASA